MAKSMSKTQFGLVVRERIEQYGYKEYEFAKKINLHKSTLSRYLSGESIPDYITALEICRALDLDINKIDTMDIDEMKKDTQKILDLRKEFERLGVIEEGQDLSQKQLDLLRVLILSNKSMFQTVDKLISADNLTSGRVISAISNPIKND